MFSGIKFVPYYNWKSADILIKNDILLRKENLTKKESKQICTVLIKVSTLPVVDNL